MTSWYTRRHRWPWKLQRTEGHYRAIIHYRARRQPRRDAAPTLPACLWRYNSPDEARHSDSSSSVWIPNVYGRWFVLFSDVDLEMNAQPRGSILINSPTYVLSPFDHNRVSVLNQNHHLSRNFQMSDAHSGCIAIVFWLGTDDNNNLLSSNPRVPPALMLIVPAVLWRIIDRNGARLRIATQADVNGLLNWCLKHMFIINITARTQPTTHMPTYDHKWPSWLAT